MLPVSVKIKHLRQGYDARRRHYETLRENGDIDAIQENALKETLDANLNTALDTLVTAISEGDFDTEGD